MTITTVTPVPAGDLGRDHDPLEYVIAELADAMEFLAKVADAIPKQTNVSANAGVPTFSVNINMTQRKADQNVIEGAVTEVTATAVASE